MNPTTKYCAIYTRKSSEEGLDLEFNSLDAQRESCLSYIQSQKSEGWIALRNHYDDGGYSGGNTNRPGLQKLLQDIRDEKINIVVVYKIDRLTRSLMDFAKLVEIFDKYQVTFVSVTQSFNTTTSMGRLTLNVLLSFAQFEREVTGERIRDKIAASKKKGMWMGGFSPIGYDIVDKQLKVNPKEAKIVRLIYNRYLALGCVKKLKAELDHLGTKSPLKHPRKAVGSVFFSRGALYKILQNPTYTGHIRHKDKIYNGRHEPIISKNLWDKVQTRLTSQATQVRGTSKSSNQNLLRKLLFDYEGMAYSPTYTIKKGKRYRYYTSQNLIQYKDPLKGIISRIPAYEIESFVQLTIVNHFINSQQLARLLCVDSKEEASSIRHIITHHHELSIPDVIKLAIKRIIVNVNTLTIQIKIRQLRRIIAEKFNMTFAGYISKDVFDILVPFQNERSRHGTMVIEPLRQNNQPKDFFDCPTYELKNWIKGIIWRDEHFNGKTLEQIAQRENVTPRYVARLIERCFRLQ